VTPALAVKPPAPPPPAPSWQDADANVQAGQLEVPLNKSQMLTVDKPFGRVMVGNGDVADIMPITARSIYVLGRKLGTTSLTIYDRGNRVMAVVDVAVGPDVISLRRQIAQLLPAENISAHMSNDAIVLTGVASSAPAIDRAVQLARTFAGEKVVNMVTVGASQQVMLEVRFSEIRRDVEKNLNFNHAYIGARDIGAIGSTALSTAIATNATRTGTDGSGPNPHAVIALSNLKDTFGIFGHVFTIGGLNVFSTLDALEDKGLVKTLAQPTLIALSGETASFLAGGEFPIPVLQSGGGTGNVSGSNSGSGITIEFKPFGVSLAFTPTVLADGVINLSVEPEVSSLDSSASVQINGLTIPGLRTRRANSVVELRDGEAFAIAGLLQADFASTVRQVPLLGSIPVIGTLFRSTGFQRGETELLIIVVPHLVRPVKPEEISMPTDRVSDPSETDLFLKGRTDGAVGTDPFHPNRAPTAAATPSAPAPAAAAPAAAAPAQAPAAAPRGGATATPAKGVNGYEY
jgi:pilus assembly protein CpaC